MVGTAYLSPEPGKPVFVNVGDKVTAGQTLLIIEAMKTFNPIKAPKAGTVAQVLIENAQPVEFGEAADDRRIDRRAMFDKVLIANRGEIALRIHRACREMGIQTVAVHSTADSDAMHVRLADEAVCIGPPPARDSYLNIPAILSAATITGADAIHPGYGFLSENARFAEAVEAHGFTFIGPTPEHIAHDGRQDRRQADRAGARPAAGAGLARPGRLARGDRGARRQDRLAGADQGGGRRRRARHEGGRERRPGPPRPLRSPAPRPRPPSATTPSMSRSISASRATSRSRCWATATAKACISASATARCSAATRRCSRKRPRPPSMPSSATRIGELAAAAVRKLKYRGAGTMEFLFQDGEFYFIEMNTRLQVEHPITEAVTGIDLVREQIRIAAGGPLALQPEGHRRSRATPSSAASTPRTRETFVPSPGKVTDYHPPGGLGVRVDSGLYAGYVIPPYYDSMVAKLIVSGPTRNECLMRLRRSLEEFVIGGIDTTIPLHQEHHRQPDFIDGDYNIHWLEKLVGLKK